MLRGITAPRRCSCRPSLKYNCLVSAGTISRDARQVLALPAFDRLYDDLVRYTQGPGRAQPRRVELQPPNRLGVVPSFFFRRKQDDKVRRALEETGSGANAAYHPLSRVKGMYVYGGVGCGKTMLMDLLYHNAPDGIKKRRVHFHNFMLEVQRTSHDVQFVKNGNAAPRPLRTPEAAVNIFDEVAQRLVADVELLCFDEVAVADVAHAMIMRRLFNAFYKMGLVVVFTSNRPPDELYLGGINRESFLPFIELVKQQCVVYDMRSETDHRLAGSDANTYLFPINADNDMRFNQLFLQLCKGMPTMERVLRVFGRDVRVRTACGGVSRFHFNEICNDATSCADYEIIAKTFHTVFIEGVPRFSYESSDIKSRFLQFIDSLYEFHCKVVIYAQVPPLQLQESREEYEASQQKLAGGDGTKIRMDALMEFERESGKKLIDASDASFQMERCISRLIEMRSREYLERSHRYEEVSLSTE
ncbi:putative ATPase [Trypanosoma rangeli]|uniref:Putative ATPase n=1 Tax=Trypanosoma rangeli TaxID=5698 RepID=A0A3R7K771_TRYRA|nr:putative ATPase [Trypanosoma rangeli]RNF02878.1 putative ATPase [Trypanosoma rangeli]|eukprot:RNF02878.1 putative ATPase [Trypanosoma rangeli]